MITNKHLKFTYIHVPKTGGNSILRPLFDSPRPEGDVVYNQDLVNDNGITSFPWKFPHSHTAGHRHTIESLGYFTFSFVRNPWDRAVSLYYWRLRLGQFANQKDPGWTFGDFLRNVRDNHPSIHSLGSFSGFWKPQTDWLFDAKGCLIDYAGKIENAQDDFDYVCRRLKTPTSKIRIINKNKEREHTDYRRYYTSDLIDIVADYYRDDIDNFEYTFE